MEIIRGIVTRVLKEDEDTGRVFLAMQYESNGGLAVAKLGAFARGLRPGDAFAAEGEWRTSRFQGRSEEVFEGRRLCPDLPRTRAGAERFLGSILSEARHGVAPEAIARLLDEHGPDVLRRAVDRPEILVGISARPSAFRAAILADWEARTKGRRAVSLMEEAGVDPAAIDRIIGAWRDEALPRLTSNPYGAARIPKVGFGNADRVGRRLGLHRHDRRRLAAAVAEVLREQEERGSTAADIPALLGGLGDVSGIDRAALRAFLEEESGRGDHDFAIHSAGGEPVCAPLRLYCAEADIVNGLHRLLTRGRRRPVEQVRAAAEALFARPEFARFDPVQRLAVVMAASEPFAILTGGPGTGKSTVMEAVARLCDQLDGGPLFLAAPTGKAAKRLAETTGRRTCTVHRLLKARGDGTAGSSAFAVNRDNPLPPGSVTVVDEASMLDVEAAAALVNALPPDGRLLLVGDRNQLPSVGPGAVLADMLAAEVGGNRAVPSISLSNVYRQSGDSLIATGAALICRGEIPELGPGDRGGVSFLELPPQAIVDEIERLVCEILPAEGRDPLRDVAVLVPQAPGRAGAWEINRRLSARLNPDGAAIPGVCRGRDDDPRMPVPRVGDRVMLTENDADNDVMNGDVGVILGACRTAAGRPAFRVLFDCGAEVEYPASRWRKLILAYAGTVHKSQGSQYPVVILPFAGAHARMLERALVYTGWTRARERLHLVGERSAFVKAVETWRGDERLTLIRRFLGRLRPGSLERPGRTDWEALAAKAQAACEATRCRMAAANANDPAARIRRTPPPRPFAAPGPVPAPASAPPAAASPTTSAARPFSAPPRSDPSPSPPAADAGVVHPFARPGGLFRPIARPALTPEPDESPRVAWDQGPRQDTWPTHQTRTDVRRDGWPPPPRL